MRAGILLEDIFLLHMGRIGGTHYRFSTQQADKEQGADCYIDGLPLDVTLKDKSHQIGCYRCGEVQVGPYKLELSVRTRNVHHVFVHPVLVLRFPCCDTEDIIRCYIGMLRPTHIEDAIGLFWDKLDSMGY